MTMDADGERRLLEEGAASYVPAVSAILTFRELVQSRFRQVLEKRLVEHSAALGVSLDKGQVVEVQTRTSDWDGRYASLGVEMRNLGVARAWLSYLLCWELGKDGSWITHVGALIWVRKRYQVEQLRKVFLPHPPNLTFSDIDKEIWLGERITPAEAGKCDDKLDNLLTIWNELWKRAGGLKVLSAAESSSEDEDAEPDASADRTRD